MLRDRIVCGIRDVRLQRRLLAEPDLTFKKTFEICQATELADKNAQNLRGSQTLPKPGPLPVMPIRAKDTPRKSGGPGPCYRCNSNKHLATNCPFKQAECHKCGKKGHIVKACRSSISKFTPTKGKKTQKTHQLSMTQDASPQRRNQKINPPIYDLFRVANSSVEPMVVNIQLNGKEVPMEVDTGASRTVMGETTFQKLLGHQLEGNAVQPSKVRLRTYTGEQLQVLGAVDVRSLKGILQRHTEVFSEELGHLKGFTAKIHVDPDAVPQFCNARPVPYALRKRVEQELSHLEAAGVIKQVEFSDWAAPIMPVTKQDGSVRISGDYQLTVNRVAKLDTYPLPRIEDLFASLSGGQEFTKLDLAHAYQQISLDEASKKYLVINTHKGLFQYNHLSFGVASAPAIFQKAMEGVLRGIDQVSVYIDDILVTGKTKADHLQHLDEVLTRLREAGLHLKKDKCAFLLSSVEYLGHTISANGLHPTTAEVRAIRDAPTSTNLQQLRSFLGLINYYSKFLPHLATTLSPCIN